MEGAVKGELTSRWITSDHQTLALCLIIIDCVIVKLLTCLDQLRAFKRGRDAQSVGIDGL
jgi:hypothetical protein